MCVFPHLSLCVFSLFLCVVYMFTYMHAFCASHAWVAGRQMLLFTCKCFLCWIHSYHPSPKISTVLGRANAGVTLRAATLTNTALHTSGSVSGWMVSECHIMTAVSTWNTEQKRWADERWEAQLQFNQELLLRTLVDNITKKKNTSPTDLRWILRMDASLLSRAAVVLKDNHTTYY